MNFIDIVSLLDEYRGKIEKVTVFGRISKVLDRPSNIYSSVSVDENLQFVQLDCFAIDLGFHSSTLRNKGIEGNGHIYMIHGSVIALVDTSQIEIPEWYAVQGVLRHGAKSRDSMYMSLFYYVKSGDKWSIIANHVRDIEPSEFDFDSEMSAHFYNCSISDCVSVPDSVKAMRPLSATPTRFERTQDPTPPSAPGTTSKWLSQFKKESRKVCKPANNMLNKFTALCTTAESNRYQYISSLKVAYSEQDTRALDYMLDALLLNVRTKPSGNGLTGKALLKGYLSHFKGASKTVKGTKKVSDVLADCLEEIVQYIRDHDNLVPVGASAWNVCKVAFADQELFYAGIVCEICGVSFEEMQKAYNICSRNDVSLITVLNKNPYVLSSLGNFNFSTVETLAIAFGRHLDNSLDSYRNIAMLNEYIQDSNNSNTLFLCSEIAKAGIGVRITPAKFSAMRSTGTYLTNKRQTNISTYLRRCSSSDLGYDVSSFKSDGNRGYIWALTSTDISKAVKSYVDAGMGVVTGDFITSYKLLAKELLIYNVMYTLGSKTFDYDTETIDKYIREYEDDVGFTLEAKQREAVHLCVNSGFLVSGGAGSGKTTVSRCIVHVLENLEPELTLRFAAPTGKAAKRMQEVTQRVCKTMHSEFKIGFEDEEFLDDSGNSGDIAYFIDEGAMVSLDLMYQCLKKVDVTSSRVFMFGDFGQLSPIGKGLPFKNLLRFMPCVFLDVPKRAIEGSNITKASNIVNEHSEPSNWVDLPSEGDFRLIACSPDEITSTVTKLCKHYLGIQPSEDFPVLEVAPDDIQVVTPISKATYDWGATKLNKALQPLFNPNCNFRNTFVYQLSEKIPGTNFSIGDRVIHTEKNKYSMQWYEAIGVGMFRKIYGNGICNGEVGKIVGFYRTDDVTIVEEAEGRPYDFSYPESLRDDTTYTGEDKYFVAVSYYDYLSERDIIILYRASINGYIQSNQGIVFDGDDLSMLNLFYAGTTHKLQGSEADLIIFVLGDINFRGFITREMLYTMITRGKKQVIGVGSVSSWRGSTLSNARRDLSAGNTLTVGEVIIDATE